MTKLRYDFDGAPGSGFGAPWADDNASVGGETPLTTSITTDGSTMTSHFEAASGGGGGYLAQRLVLADIGIVDQGLLFLLSGRIRRPSGAAGCNFRLYLFTSGNSAPGVNLNSHASAPGSGQFNSLTVGELTPDAWYLFKLLVDPDAGKTWVKFWAEGDAEPNWFEDYTFSDLGLNPNDTLQFAEFDPLGPAHPPLGSGEYTAVEADWLQIEFPESDSRFWFRETFA